MSETHSANIRREIRRVVQTHQTITVEEVVLEVSRDKAIDEADVVEAIDELERNGFIYLSECPGGNEVRLP